MPDIHHKSGPSGLKHIAVCPGFEQQNFGDNARAEIGTLQHKAFETRNLDILPDAETKQAVQMCLDIADKIIEGADEIHREVLLDVCGERSFGTSDLVAVFNKRRHAAVIDEKYGHLPVDPCENNWQVWDYVTAVFDRWPHLKTVTAWLLIPYQDIVDHHTFSRADVDALKEKTLGARVRRDMYLKTRDAKMLRKSMGTCQYCKHLGMCPATSSVAKEIAVRYEPMLALPEVHSSVIRDTKQMAQALDMAKVLKKLAESIEHHAKNMAHEFGGLPDENGELLYELRSVEGARIYDDKKIKEIVDVLSSFGLSPDEILSVSKINIQDAIDLVKSKAPRGKKGKVGGELEVALYDNEVFLPGEPTTKLSKVKKKVDAEVQALPSTET